MGRGSVTTLTSISTYLCGHILSSQYYIAAHGQVKGEQNMMAEISAHGPIACTIAVTVALENYMGGIFNDTTGAKVPPLPYKIV